MKKIIVSVFCLLSLLSCKKTETLAKNKFIKPTNQNIEYVGRWDKSNSEIYHSYWGGAYFDVKFFGNQLELKLVVPVDIYVKLDNDKEVLYPAASGVIKVTPSNLGTGIHTIRVIAKFQNDEIQLAGLFINDEGELLEPEKRTHWVEFIGDSITSGDQTSKGNSSAYPWLCGEDLKVNHTQISYCGIPLVNGNYYTYQGAPQIGMESAYFNLMQPNHQPNKDWDFTQYTPDVIVTNLGTNDIWLNVSASNFQSKYSAFIQKLTNQFPKAKILVMIPFSKVYQEEIKDMVVTGYSTNNNIKVIETENWLSLTDFADGSHPNDNGHAIIAYKLSRIIKDHL